MAINATMEEKYLERLTRAFLSLDAERNVSTKEFIEAVDAIMPVFDYLGKQKSFYCRYNEVSGLCGSISCVSFLTRRVFYPCICSRNLPGYRLERLLACRDSILICKGGDE
jgi:hypothetical protein